MSGRVELFGCRIDRLRMPEAVARVYEIMAERRMICQYVVTPNVQHILMLQNHDGLRRAYEDAALILADGMPMVFASRLLRRGVPERVAGSDLVPALFERAGAQGGVRVFLLGAAPGVAQRASERIMARWPAVEVVGAYGPPYGFENDPSENAAILERIQNCRPDILFVGLGAPKQEMWVHKYRSQIAAPIALCIGATIDFLAGHKRRAPRWMQKSGLEWCYRAATEPRRLLWRYASDAWRFPRIVWHEWRTMRDSQERG